MRLPDTQAIRRSESHCERRALVGATPVISSQAGRRVPRPYDRALCKQRNWIGHTFNTLKDCRRLAIHYDRKTTCFAAFLHLAAFVLWQN